MLQAAGLQKKKAFAGPHGHAENMTYHNSKKDGTKHVNRTR